MELATALRNNYMFRGLPASVLNVMAAYANVQKFAGGDTLVRQFERNRDIVVILEGHAVTRNFNGEAIASFGPGSVVGEMALVDGQPRSANVVCMGSVKAAMIPFECIEGLVDVDAEFGSTLYQNIAKVLSKRLRTMNEQAGVPVGAGR